MRPWPPCSVAARSSSSSNAGSWGQARAALVYGSEFMGVGVDPVMVRLLEEALVATGVAGTPVAAQLGARLALALVPPARPEVEERIGALAEAALATARHAGDPEALLYVLQFSGMALAYRASGERCLELARETMQLARQLDRRVVQLRVGPSYAVYLLERGQRAAAEAVLNELTALAAVVDYPQSLWRLHMLRAGCAFFDGRLAAAEQLGDEARQLAESAGTTAAREWGSQRVGLAIVRGDPAGIRSHAEQLSSLFPRGSLLAGFGAWVDAALGRRSEALAALREARAGLPGFPQLIAQAEACVLLADTEAAPSLVQPPLIPGRSLGLALLEVLQQRLAGGELAVGAGLTKRAQRRAQLDRCGLQICVGDQHLRQRAVQLAAGHRRAESLVRAQRGPQQADGTGTVSFDGQQLAAGAQRQCSERRGGCELAIALELVEGRPRLLELPRGARDDAEVRQGLTTAGTAGEAAGVEIARQLAQGAAPVSLLEAHQRQAEARVPAELRRVQERGPRLCQGTARQLDVTEQRPGAQARPGRGHFQQLDRRLNLAHRFRQPPVDPQHLGAMHAAERRIGSGAPHLGPARKSLRPLRRAWPVGARQVAIDEPAVDERARPGAEPAGAHRDGSLVQRIQAVAGLAAEQTRLAHEHQPEPLEIGIAPAAACGSRSQRVLEGLGRFVGSEREPRPQHLDIPLLLAAGLCFEQPGRALNPAVGKGFLTPLDV